MESTILAAATPFNPTAEWLEADGLGGFASGSVSGIRTRRYHALLLTATAPPTGRFVLVNGFDAWVDTPHGTCSLSSQRYAPDVIHPDGAQRIKSFTIDPWPCWRFELDDGTVIEHELFVCHNTSVVALAWRLQTPRTGVSLSVRPFFSGRDYHSLHHENPAFRFEGTAQGVQRRWQLYPDVPAILTLSNGEYIHQPDWYRNFSYTEERARGLDYTEDLATPGTFRWDMSKGEAILILAAEGHENGVLPHNTSTENIFTALRTAEKRRRSRFPSPLHRAADAYLAQRGTGKTLVAGYPWFTDWGRDTFIALRGLCLATGRLEEARDILLAWAGTVSEGMLPNRFPDHGDTPEFNSVDASLWYIIAVHDFLQAVEDKPRKASQKVRSTLQEAIEAILTGFAKGTRYGIHADADGLLAAGEADQQLTWMDARVDGHVITPRIGKPVEIQALWLNALHIASRFATHWQELLARGRTAFQQRFWHEAGGYVYDVVDVDHQPGMVDAAFRPNQIFAVGGLPIALIEGAQAKCIVDAVEQRLWTPLGLRSLAPDDPSYVPHYQGGVWQRDSAYHQGTVWPWLVGPFVEAWVRVRGNTAKAKREARERFLAPLFQHLDNAGIGHISEIVDGDTPHTPRGCPFQAWSVGEMLRLELSVLSR
ncbi:MAG: glycogen debranching protein [Deltaproteobacteria bacterium]|nr:glycogen debranching protein [Deltaproteobacteria bacterium]